ncbi:MAG: phosphoadenosine phosphosulfate reductase [Gemmobacter sp.]|nr:phosphoadenosine phosphosulfate reductase [Gemmobacter sp.]
MTQTTRETVSRYDASTAVDRSSWILRLEEICEEDGYFERLGPRHFAFFADEGATLLVSFETLADIRAEPRQMPKGMALAERHGWSHLCVIAEGGTWYRDQAVYRYFDRLVEDAFFEDFDRVVFYGARMGGYAACAFSVCAPEATVLAVQPRATLDPSVAGWDRRHIAEHRLCFTDRYGYAPDMTEGAGRVFILCDPRQREDAMHAALFIRPYVRQLRTEFLGEKVESGLLALGILPDLIDAAGSGTLCPALFHRIWRRRRAYGPWLTAILAEAEQTGHPAREAMICRAVTRRFGSPLFRRRLAEIEARLAVDA